ncbi:16S rRNA (uracil(1498)-N(3))-methyltransferase [Adlercreutzia sp. ZJ154]|uniref:RsmE family RNA methyltransferase n=1 Tax=Adlercreutzia sp. ZJ154 TaxID=2709790 RepID=UPI0013EE183D|nr:RsmE family RNA methyltransferase [Adlercreutzia sp. ZJ154]
MSLHHFFLDDQVLVDETAPEFVLRLAVDDLKHARALRIKCHEHIAVIDATQDYFECEVVNFNGSEMIVRICQHVQTNLPAWNISLVQGIAKADKMDDIVRHTTELGVARIIPMQCSRTVVKLAGDKAKKKTQRWLTIAKSAAMQSGRSSIPHISDPMALSAVIDTLSEMDIVLVCWEEAAQAIGIGQALSNKPNAANIALVIGPEGGLEKSEVDAILACNSEAHLVSLGSTILRTETAGIVASAIAIYELGGLGNSSIRSRR